MAGAVIMQLGVVLIAPLVLRAAARVFSRFGAGARLGTRDIARNPGRSVPAIAAIMSTVFVAAFAMSLIASTQETANKVYRYTTAVNAAWVSLYTYDDDGQRVLEADGKKVVAALNSSFAAADARLLSSAPDPFLPGTPPVGANTATTFVYPRVDPDTVCPRAQPGPIRRMTRAVRPCKCSTRTPRTASTTPGLVHSTTSPRSWANRFQTGPGKHWPPEASSAPTPNTSWTTR